MCISIKEISPNRYEVNDKVIYKGMDGNWHQMEELKPSEEKAFKQHLKSIENGN